MSRLREETVSQQRSKRSRKTTAGADSAATDAPAKTPRDQLIEDLAQLVVRVHRIRQRTAR